MIYLCEVVSLGVWPFGSTLCTWIWYQSVYEEPLSVLIKIWNQCCRKFERVYGSGVSVHLWPVEVVPLHLELRFHLEIVFVSSKTFFVWSRNTNFGKSEGIMLQWRICLIFFLNLSYFINFIIRSLLFVSDCCLPWLRMLFAMHLVRSRQFRNNKEKFFLSSRLRILFVVHFVWSWWIGNNEKTWKYRLFGKANQDLTP